MGLCPPSPDKLSLGPQINIQAKHWLYIIESWCHECTTGATLDAATMLCTHRHTHTSTLGCQLRSVSRLLGGGNPCIQNHCSMCPTHCFMVDFTLKSLPLETDYCSIHPEKKIQQRNVHLIRCLQAFHHFLIL